MFESIFSAILHGITKALASVLSWFTMNMELDLEKFYNMFPILSAIYEGLTPIAFALVLFLAAYSLYKYFTGGIAEVKERPTILFMRVLLASGAVLFGGHFVSLLVKLASFPYDAFCEMAFDNSAMYGTLGSNIVGTIAELIPNLITEGLGMYLGDAHIAYLLVCIIVTLMVGYNILKLVLEILERYLMVGILAYMSPLAFATLATQGSSMVFSRWLGMLVGQCLLMTLSAASYNIVLSGLGTMTWDGTDALFKLLLVMAACRVGCRVDTYLQQLGVGVGTTGGSLMDEMMSLVRTAMTVGKAVGGKGKAAASGDGTGHAATSVLGGRLASDGSVVPDAQGSGLLGAFRTAYKRGKAAYDAGESKGAVQAAAQQGFTDGMGRPDIPKDGTIGQKVAAAATSPLVAGRWASNKFAHFSDARNAARASVTKEQAGTAYKAPDGSINLNDTAKKNGVSMNKDGGLTGKDSQAVADVAAANISEPVMQDAIRQMARTGSNEAAEKTPWGNHNDLQYDPDSGMEQSAYDQNMSDLALSTYGADMARMEENEEMASEEQRGVLEAYRAMRGSMDGTYDDGRLANVQVGDRGGNPDNGREMTADLQTKEGTTFGKMSVLDQKAYNQLSDAEKQGYVPLQSATGGLYYAKTNSVSETGELGKGPLQNPMPEIKDVGADTTSMAGKEVLYGTENAAADAARMNTLLNSDNPHVKQIAENTAKDDAACPPEEAKAALFSPDTGAINAGHDAAVASMMKTAIPPESLNQAATAMQSSKGKPIAQKHAKHFSDAVQAAASGQGATADGYSVQNLTKDSSGVVRGEFVTPQGQQYGFAMQQQLLSSESIPAGQTPAPSVASAPAPAGGRVSSAPAAHPAPAYEEDWASGALDPDYIPPDDSDAPPLPHEWSSEPGISPLQPGPQPKLKQPDPPEVLHTQQGTQTAGRARQGLDSSRQETFVQKHQAHVEVMGKPTFSREHQQLETPTYTMQHETLGRVRAAAQQPSQQTAAPPKPVSGAVAKKATKPAEKKASKKTAGKQQRNQAMPG